MNHFIHRSFFVKRIQRPEKIDNQNIHPEFILCKINK